MIKKSNHQNQPWSLSDSNYAWDEHKLGRSHKYIARKLGRSEKAVEINISKTRIRTKKAKRRRVAKTRKILSMRKSQTAARKAKFRPTRTIPRV